MKKIILCFLLVCGGLVIFADTVAKAWPVSGAQYRLQLNLGFAEVPGFIDLARYVIPGDLTNGVDVRDAKGGELAFRWDAESGELITGKGVKSPIYVYYGFDKPQIKERWNVKTDGAVPELRQFSVFFTRARINFKTEQEWFDNQNARIESRYRLRYDTMDNLLKKLFRDKVICDNRYAMAELFDSLILQGRRQQLKTLQKVRKPDMLTVRQINRLTTLIVSRVYPNFKPVCNLSSFEPRIKSNIQNVLGLQEQYDRDIENARKQMPGVLSRTVVDTFNRHSGGQRNQRPPNGPQLQGGRRPGPPGGVGEGRKEVAFASLPQPTLEQRGSAVALFNGNLVVTADGEYSFAMNANNTCVLYIDDKVVIDWPGVHEGVADWKTQASLPLTQGLHDIKIYYHKSDREAFIQAGWKKKADKEFKILAYEDFSPGWPLTLKTVFDVSGKSYPVVKRLLPTAIYTDKQKKMTWERCVVEDSPVPTQLQWVFNNEVVRTGVKMDLFMDPDKKEDMVLQDKSGTMAPLKISFMSEGGNRLEKLIAYPDVTLKLWLPFFLYDDETLEMYWEIKSQMPRDFDCSLEFMPNMTNAVFKAETRNFSIPAWTGVDEQLFRPAKMVKEKIDLPGALLGGGVSVQIKAFLPGLILDRQTVKFMPLEACRDLIIDEDGCLDAEGTRIVPLLHRPTLDELREWELPRQLSKNILKPSNILVIGDDFACGAESLKTTMEKQLMANNVKMTFIPWRKDGLSRNSVTGEFSVIMKAIKASTADAVIITAPSGSPVESARELQRLMSAVVQLCRGNRNIQSVYVTTPYPLANGRESELSEEVRRMARSYGVDLLDVNAFVRNIPEWKKLYDDDSGTMQEAYPIKALQPLTQFILQPLN